MSPGDSARSTPAVEPLGEIARELLHDLLGVLTVAEDRCRLARDQVSAHPDARPELDRALRDLAGATEMIREALLVQAGDHTYPVALVGIIQTEIDRIAVGSPRTKIELQVARGYSVPGPPSFVGRAVANLLRNAVRHARTRVRLAVRDLDAGGLPGVQVSVEDDGPGVPAEIRNDLFRPGVRGADATAAGYGLGLSSAAWVVGHLGGTVAYVGVGELGGARFDVWLPARLGRGAATQVAEARPALARPLAGWRLLLVDDQPEVRRVLARLLERAGATVEAVGPEATDEPGFWARVAETSPRAVLLDYRMGGRDGVELWWEMRRVSESLSDRAIFVSGTVGLAVLGGSAGNQPWLAKPLQIDDLIDRVSKMDAHQARRARRS